MELETLIFDVLRVFNKELPPTPDLIRRLELSLQQITKTTEEEELINKALVALQNQECKEYKALGKGLRDFFVKLLETDEEQPPNPDSDADMEEQMPIGEQILDESEAHTQPSPTYENRVISYYSAIINRAVSDIFCNGAESRQQSLHDLILREGLVSSQKVAQALEKINVSDFTPCRDIIQNGQSLVDALNNAFHPSSDETGGISSPLSPGEPFSQEHDTDYPIFIEKATILLMESTLRTWSMKGALHCLEAEGNLRSKSSEEIRQTARLKLLCSSIAHHIVKVKLESLDPESFPECMDPLALDSGLYNFLLKRNVSKSLTMKDDMHKLSLNHGRFDFLMGYL